MIFTQVHNSENKNPYQRMPSLSSISCPVLEYGSRTHSSGFHAWNTMVTAYAFLFLAQPEVTFLRSCAKGPKLAIFSSWFFLKEVTRVLLFIPIYHELPWISLGLRNFCLNCRQKELLICWRSM